MQGKVLVHLCGKLFPGITPAYAGKRCVVHTCSGVDKDHPRVCGEKTNSPFLRVYQVGSPPCMRGKVSKTLTGTLTKGITPAYAGKRW